MAGPGWALILSSGYTRRVQDKSRRWNSLDMMVPIKLRQILSQACVRTTLRTGVNARFHVLFAVIAVTHWVKLSGSGKYSSIKCDGGADEHHFTFRILYLNSKSLVAVRIWATAIGHMRVRFLQTALNIIKPPDIRLRDRILGIQRIGFSLHLLQARRCF